MDTITTPELVKITSIPDESNKSARSRLTYASFGDEGVTATANAHGHLLQITRYFGNESSGFYCVDLPGTPLPSLSTSRLKRLEDFYHDSDVGMRLEIANFDAFQDWVADSERPPAMKFIDDRWPLFVTETPFFDLSIQYFISEKTIYQEYSFELKQGYQIESIPELFINANLLIRNLNFIESSAENSNGDKAHSYETPQNSRIIRKHGSPQTGIPGNDTVGLVIMSFINEHHRDIEETEDRDKYKISLKNDEFLHLQRNGKMVVTIAYTLELIGSADLLTVSNNVSKATQCPSEAERDLSTAKTVMDMKFEILLFANEGHLNFILRRNLEHILSVCSIPIGYSSASIVPIALTCGDISNHRIASGASFYAFEFLLLALKFLEALQWTCSCDPKVSHCDEYKCRLRYRIRRTCEGHLLWLYRTAEKPQDVLCSHYWVSGKVIENPEAINHLAKKSIMDTPFHIIKAADFCRIISDRDICDTISKEYKHIFGGWIQDLHKNNKHNEYVFPRCEEKTTPKFYFAEQVMIWRALKSAKELGIETSAHSYQNYSALRVQNSVLQKFSCESPLSKKSLIAISRSPHGNKFNLKTRDTVIFYSLDHGIFDTHEDTSLRPNKLESWRNTLDHQMELHGNKNASWSDLLEVALAIIISTKSKYTNSDAIKHINHLAKQVLLRSSSPNGLLAGQLNEYNEPIFPSNVLEYHNHWHSSFEIPYILWMYWVDSSDADTLVDESSSTAESSSSSKQISSHEHCGATYANNEKVAEYLDKWLYNMPRFLKFQADLGEKAMENFITGNTSDNSGIVINKAFKIMQERLKAPIEPERSANLSKGYIINVPEVTSAVKKTFLPCHILHPNDLRLQLDPRVASELQAYYARLFDVSESRAISRRSESTICDIDPLLAFTKNDKHLLPTFTSSDAYIFSAPMTKRLMHFYQMDFELAMMCYRASSEAEDLSRFFDRHATYDKYFYEDAQLTFNNWTTELHLSFYQVLSHDTIMPSGISEPRKIEFPSFGDGDKPQSIGRVSLSLRFDGDLFDSSWICYFIEYNPQRISKKDNVQTFSENLSIGSATKKVDWQERRILELLILDKMLDEILQSSRKFLQEIKHSILKNSRKSDEICDRNQQEIAIDYDTSMLLAEFDIFDKTPNDVFLSIHSAWHKFQRITDIVEEDLQENILTIALWMNREKERRDKPQWSESNERKHAWTLSQLSAINNRKFDELKRCHDSIKVFSESLGKRMEVARSKWEIQSTNDIRLFTYVTVVFLPIGFAISVFSMSDAPSGQTLRHMIMIAAVALGITIIALFNANHLDSKMVRPVFHTCRSVFKPLFSIVVLPWVYFIARYAYYPALSKFSDGPLQKHSGKLKQANEMFHKFDKPLLRARNDFDKVKHLREQKQEMVLVTNMGQV